MTLPQRFPAPAVRRVPGERSRPSLPTVPIVNWLARPRRSRRGERAWLHHLPDFAMQLSRAVRSGASIDHALQDIANIDESLPARVRSVAARVATGQPITVAIDGWAQEAQSEPERLLISALRAGQRVGAQMGPVLDGLAMALRDELALEARRRVLLVQAQLSAAVLVIMPLGFAALSSVMRGGFAFSGARGLVLLIAGLMLDGFGVLWMRRLLRGLR